MAYAGDKLEKDPLAFKSHFKNYFAPPSHAVLAQRTSCNEGLAPYLCCPLPGTPATCGHWALGTWPVQLRNWNFHFTFFELIYTESYVASVHHLRQSSCNGFSPNPSRSAHFKRWTTLSQMNVQRWLHHGPKGWPWPLTVTAYVGLHSAAHQAPDRARYCVPETLTPPSLNKRLFHLCWAGLWGYRCWRSICKAGRHLR